MESYQLGSAMDRVHQAVMAVGLGQANGAHVMRPNLALAHEAGHLAGGMSARERAAHLMRLIKRLQPGMPDADVVLEVRAAMPVLSSEFTATQLTLMAAELSPPAEDLAVAIAASQVAAVTPAGARIGAATSPASPTSHTNSTFMPGPPRLAAEAVQAATDAGVPPDGSMFPGPGNLGVL